MANLDNTAQNINYSGDFFNHACIH